MKKIAINGFGRIGRLVFRIIQECNDLEVVAINDLSTPEELAYLLKYDTNHRGYNKEISYDDEFIIVDNQKIKIFKEMDPINLPWKNLDIDVVLECTGKFTSKEKAISHIEAGAKKVLISAPGKGEMKTVVYNVNNDKLPEIKSRNNNKEESIKVFNYIIKNKAFSHNSLNKYVLKKNEQEKIINTMIKHNPKLEQLLYKYNI